MRQIVRFDQASGQTCKEVDDMAKAKTGDRYVCDECGMIISVDEACGCETCEIICCDAPMAKAAPAAKKAVKKAAPKKAKAAVKLKAARK
jgi:ribosomal protein L37AE/L43A